MRIKLNERYDADETDVQTYRDDVEYELHVRDDGEMRVYRDKSGYTFDSLQALIDAAIRGR